MPKIKAPLESKADLIEEVTILVESKLSPPEFAVRWLLEQFSTFDLVAIRKMLKETK